ncbi:MAG: CotY/CotZ family spore coat protein [Erysipelotrichales bacterium]|nr:CotY/CotZ family spore coat protein [Erysipelotrichales bacterium]
MSCGGVTNNSVIIENCRRIDKMQKEVVTGLDTDCITCEASLVSKAFNTIPVSFFSSNFEPLRAFVEGDKTTPFFRIENIRENHFVTLRLLVKEDEKLEATNQTCVLNLNCVCCMECFEPINAPSCFY